MAKLAKENSDPTQWSLDDGVTLHGARIRRRCITELSERLKTCKTAAQISSAVAEILGRVLDCARAGYALVNDQNTRVEADWTNGTIASLTGEHAFSALGRPYVDLLRRGETLVAPDVRIHPAFAGSYDCWGNIGVRALVNVPLMDDGLLVAMTYVHATRPRAWTREEVLLLQEVADRAWESMGRALAADALRQMNDTLEAQIQERTLQRDRLWTLSTDLMMVTNLDGVILSVNPAWTRLLGWDEDDLVGAHFYDFVHPDDVSPTRSARRDLEGGAPIEKLENRYVGKDGRVVWLSWKAVPDGDVIHSLARDVTAEREQADALRAAEDALRQIQKMEAVGQLTGGIAHDFNNLLQGIGGSLELSQKRIDQGRLGDVAPYIDQAQQCVQRAAALTHRLLAFSRRQALDPKPVRANPLIVSMEPLLRRTLGETIELDLDLAQDLWLTRCDANQLDSAILNLTINGRDAMPDGGVLTIRSRNLPDVTGRGVDDAVVISVSDTGVGMAPDVLARAFDPFYTTKPMGQGTGLGLSMIYGFMRQSGGEAKITSTPGAGTVVELRFPRFVGETAVETPAPKSLRRDKIGQGAILLVEDDPAVRRVVKDVLRQQGYHVMDAHDGPAGLEILQSPTVIDMLVTDIGLPGLNGRQIAEAGRQTRPALKVLFMTGYAEAAAMPSGSLGPDMALITKPFAIESLESQVQRLILS